MKETEKLFFPIPRTDVDRHIAARKMSNIEPIEISLSRSTHLDPSAQKKDHAAFRSLVHKIEAIRQFKSLIAQRALEYLFNRLLAPEMVDPS